MQQLPGVRCAECGGYEVLADLYHEWLTKGENDSPGPTVRRQCVQNSEWTEDWEDELTTELQKALVEQIKSACGKSVLKSDGLVGQLLRKVCEMACSEPLAESILKFEGEWDAYVERREEAADSELEDDEDEDEDEFDDEEE